MKYRLNQLCIIFVTVILVCFVNGCDETAEHHEIDFSPEGKYVVFISDEESKNGKSEIMARIADNDDEEPFSVYKAPDGMKLYSVFWKSDRIILFESGEVKSCPEPPEDVSDIPEDKIPEYKIRVASFPTSVVEEKGNATPETIFEGGYKCWDPDSDYDKTKFLGKTHISNSRDSDFIVFENFDKREESEEGLYLLNVKTVKLKLILKNRDVRYPAITDDGKKIAFVEVLPAKNEKDKNEEADDVENLRILDIETNSETPVITLLSGIHGRRAFGIGGSSVWSKDNRFLFFAGVSPFAFTTVCEKSYVKNGYVRTKNEDDNKSLNDNNETSKLIDKVVVDGDEFAVWDDGKKSYHVANLDEGVKSGHCKILRGPFKSTKLSENSYFYKDDIDGTFTIHKYYSDYGIAVKLLDFVANFSINPEREEILASRYSVENDDIHHYLFDYSGKTIKEVNYEYVENYKAVDAQGNIAGTVQSRDRQIPVLLDSVNNEERIIIARKEDVLALARYHFDRGELNKARENFEKYRDKYGLPENVGDRLLMVDTYRRTKSFKRMVTLMKEVPDDDLIKYFKSIEQQ